MPTQTSSATGTNEQIKRTGFSLPAELLDKAVQRLCVISVVAAISAVAMFTIATIWQPEFDKIQNHPVTRLLLLAPVLVSLGYAALQWAGWVSKQTIVFLGSAFQVFVALCISIAETSLLVGPEMPIVGVSKLGLWLVLCGTFIPATPAGNLLAGSMSAAMWPLGYWISMSIFGNHFIGWNRVLTWLVPMLLCVVVTNMINRRVFAWQLRSYKAETLGNYNLMYLIGKGGMGEVWRAKHRLLARDAAVKLIRPEILTGRSMRDESVIRRRFEREARATASLRSPHTVALYDFGVNKDGLFFYVMELLLGIDLQTLVTRFGPLPPGRVRNILIQVCESLEEAHRLGMVHRDIKPRNIFLSKMGSQLDFAKVLDFGLVKTQFAEDEGLTTADGHATGTPAYMAPEVAIGAKTIDGRADIYALGCVGYFLLTGGMVFDESSATALAIAHVNKTPLPPSERTEFAIPSALEQIVMQCLEKEPERRPQSAYDIARRLEALTDVPRFCRDKASVWWDTNLPMQDVTPFQPESASAPDLESVRV